ncbi:hypothetical protein B0H16DRAFT_1718451 [Mycena metata]|uniref:Uncharacterized protein n=1 Tax=Mycena metata TaxID=1033252 RepID=A0AAD7JI05_9AGAR|nr:hypothetical protein B0H16DRAFT_1718451 [Mycena metata]
MVVVDLRYDIRTMVVRTLDERGGTLKDLIIFCQRFRELYGTRIAVTRGSKENLVGHILDRLDAFEATENVHAWGVAYNAWLDMTRRKFPHASREEEAAR